MTDLDKLAKWADEWPYWKWTDKQNDALKSLIASARRDAEEIERLREALTPSGATKAAYHGEFKFTQYGRDDDGDDYSYETYVPWTTVKEIMAAIRARAAHTGEG